jgi:hypothetical protein
MIFAMEGEVCYGLVSCGVRHFIIARQKHREELKPA